MNYYIKVRDRAFGPFSADKIRAMFKQGNLDAASPISTDRQNWREAASYPELFASTQAPAAPSQSSAASAAAPSQSSAASAAASPQSSAFAGAPAAARPSWFLSLDGKTGSGPYSANELAAMLRDGRAGGNSLVWRDGENARPMNAEPEFASLFSQPASPYDCAPASASSQSPSRLADQLAQRYRGYWLSCLVMFLLPLFGVLLFFLVALFIDGDEETLLLLEATLLVPFCVAGPAVCGLLSQIFLLMFVHAFYRALPADRAPTTPGPAWGLLLIPFFNIYWNFVVFYQGSNAANAAVKEVSLYNARKTVISETLALLYPLGILVCPLVSFFLSFPLLAQMRDVGIELTKAGQSAGGPARPFV